MAQIADETAVTALGEGRYGTELSTDWNIGTNPNGGYAVLPVLRALQDVAGRPDPLSLTVHYLRPALGGVAGVITTRVVRAGRAATFVTGSLVQGGTERITVAAVMGDATVAVPDAADLALTVGAPPIARPEDCIDRAELNQGVELPLLSRLDVRVAPTIPEEPAGAPAVVDGWIRLRDGTPPAATWLPLFADAFPPTVLQRIDQVGWVPTLELTVHVRRRPAPGWIQARVECDDVAGGWMIETGTLWDATGALVARSRQLGMVLAR